MLTETLVCSLSQWKEMNALRVGMRETEVDLRIMMTCSLRSSILQNYERPFSFQCKHPLFVNILQGVRSVTLKTINIPNLACTAESVMCKVCLFQYL